jgi:hypothetical protein
MKTQTPTARLNGFIAKFSPDVAALGRAVLARFREILPPAFELVYDNYNFFVVGFGPSERPSEAVFSVVFSPRGISLCFIQGARLPDPQGLLQGSGNQVRNIKLPTAATLDEPKVRALIASAVQASPISFDPAGRRKLIIRSISTKQRPRRLPPGK